MFSQYKEIIYSILLGTVLGAVGVFLMGYVAAIYIPEQYILWFGNNQLALVTINFISQFLGFGIIAIATGFVLGRLSKRWFLNSLVCYLAFLLYLSVGTALVYGGEISPPYVGFTYYDFPSILLLPICLFLSTCLTSRKL
jgi:hypothetical protein